MKHMPQRRDQAEAPIEWGEAPEPVARQVVAKNNGDTVVTEAYTDEAADLMFRAGMRRRTP